MAAPLDSERQRSGFGSIYTRPDRQGWWLKFSHEGRRIRRLAGSTRRQAEAKRAAVHALLMQRKPLEEIMADVFGDLRGSRISFRELAGLYLEHVKGTRRAGTFGIYSSRLRTICGEHWARKPVERIRKDEIARWALKIGNEGFSGPTVKYHLSAGSAACRWGMEQGLVTGNPFGAVKPPKDKRPPREVFLSPDEARALQDASPANLRPILHCALATGMRRGELLTLRWADVDLDAGTVHVRAEIAKNGKDRTIPCTPELLRDLRALKDARQVFRFDRRDAVFERAPGKPWQVHTLYVAFKKTLAACEAIPADKRERFRFHDLRHTAASLMAAQGIPLLDIGRILGHSSQAMTARYAHFAPEAGRRAIAALGAALHG